MEKTRCSRRDVLRLAGAGVAAGLLPAFPRVPCWAQDLDLAFPRDGIDPEFSWVNQMQGPRPTHVWENWEDLLYDLETNPEPIIRAPEIQPFMKRVWVFNRTIQWHDEGLDGCLLSYSAGGDLMLTGAARSLLGIPTRPTSSPMQVISRGSKRRQRFGAGTVPCFPPFNFIWASILALK